MTLPSAIVHIGAPKCGSSALQAAFSAAPDHLLQGGRQVRYVSWRKRGPRVVSLLGNAVRQQSLRSPYGYVSWPNIGGYSDEKAAPFWRQMRKLTEAAHRGGDIPAFSNEGWIYEPERFGAEFARWDAGPLDVVACVRPPLEWLNAAYWQWGIWTGLPFSQWYARSKMSYRFGEVLETWGQLSNVRLWIHNSRRDTVAAVAGRYGLSLAAPETRNSGASAALISFLFRNRAFRTDGHDASAVFVVQRWCPPVPGPKPWALTAKDVQVVRGDTIRDVRRLQALVSEETAAEIAADPAWSDETAYHPYLQQGVPKLRDMSCVPALYRSLYNGVSSVCEVTGRAPDVPNAPPPDGSDLEVWDAALSVLLRRLLEEDRLYRHRQSGGVIGGLRRFLPGA